MLDPFGLEAEKSKDRRITIHTDDGMQHYTVVYVEHTSVPDTYRLRINSSAGAWLGPPSTKPP